MNKLVITITFIFWLAVAFFAGAAVFGGNKDQDTSVLLGQKLSNNQAISGVAAGDGRLTLADYLPQHDQDSNCWVAIDGSVYDVAGFLKLHPGGAGEITPYCGQDATVAFNTRGEATPQPHSQLAHNMLKDFYVGALTDAVADGSPVGQTINSNSPTQPLAISDSTGSGSQPANNVNPAPAVSNVSLTAAEIAKHNISSDCWATYGNTVYNVTGFIRLHPGGADRIIPYCGRDLQAAFDAEGHSGTARNILAGLEIGILGSSATQEQISTPADIPVENNQLNNLRWDDDNEDEHEEEDDD